jgi:hypothetical protein
MKTYKGQRTGCAINVTVDGFPLNPRLDIWDYSPYGFEWGYDMEGTAQLALALLADFLGDDMKALRLHHDFKRTLLVPLHHDYNCWVITENEMRSYLATLH